MHSTHRLRYLTFALFVFLSIYFTGTYKYFPGLEVRVSGSLEKNISGKIYWDYGYGFNELDSTAIMLHDGTESLQGSLGKVRIEPAGFKNDSSEDYRAWIVVPKECYKSRDYVLKGEHHWGRWLQINKENTGRQLALFPGASVEFQAKANTFPIYIYKAPESGFVKIQSDNGPIRYYDGYGAFDKRAGINRKWNILPVIYSHGGVAPLPFISAIGDSRKHASIGLPHQEIKRIKFDLSNRIVKDVHPYQRIRISGGTPGSEKDKKQCHIKSIFVNGQNISSNREIEILSAGGKREDFILDNRDDSVELVGDIYSYDVVFAPESESKEVEISYDDDTTTVGSPVKRSGEERVSGRAEVVYNQFLINKVGITGADGNTYTFENESPQDPLVVSIGLEGVIQTSSSTFLIVFQLFVACAIAFLFHYFSKRFCLSGSSSQKSLLVRLFVSEKRWFFWTILLIGLSVNLLYLAADWPGSMSPDSVFSHKETKLLKFTNHHPYSYSLLMLGLQNIFDAPVATVFFQLVLFHLLCASFFYFLYKWGVKLYLLLPFYLLVPLSVPVNLLNITVWKDVPYSLAVLFWAFFLAYLACQRWYKQKTYSADLATTVLLSVLFLMLCSLRHNGLVYLPYVPFALLVICRVSVRWLVKFVLVSSVVMTVYYFVLPPYVLYKKPKANGYAKMEVTKHMGQMGAVAKGENKYFLEHYLAERTRKFVATLGTSPKASTWYNDMHNPPARWLVVDEIRAEMATRPLSSFLAGQLSKILKTRYFTGFTSGRFVHWNSLFGFVGLLLIALLYKWLPVSAFYSSFFLYQGFFMYFFTWERWRYLYFIYLGGMFLLPIVTLELTKIRAKVNSRAKVNI